MNIFKLIRKTKEDIKNNNDEEYIRIKKKELKRLKAERKTKEAKVKVNRDIQKERKRLFKAKHPFMNNLFQQAGSGVKKGLKKRKRQIKRGSKSSALGGSNTKLQKHLFG